jgi:Predicted enzyme with a TIM-barrel fold
VARYASVVHSVDRQRLIGALGKAARRAGRVIECLVEVSLDGDPARGGAVAGRFRPWPRRWRPRKGSCLAA